MYEKLTFSLCFLLFSLKFSHGYILCSKHMLLFFVVFFFALTFLYNFIALENYTLD